MFSGAGGLDLAALELFRGSSMAWHAEIDPGASKALAHHWPDVPNLGDVSAVDWSAVEPIDVLTGGYPCQPFSSAGKRKGSNDERHLWPYVREAIRHLRPRFTLLENVAGHRSLGFDRVLGDMATDGLHAAWCSVRASDVGAAHRRERLFILAYAADTNGAGSEALSGRPRAGHLGRPQSVVRRQPDGPRAVALLPTPQVADVTGGHRARSGARSNELLLPGVVEAYASGTLLPTPRASDGTKGGPNQRGSSGDLMLPSADVQLAAVQPEWGRFEAAVRGQEARSRPAPSPTEPNRNGDPRLSPAFAEWLMFWPEGWVTAAAIGLSRTDQLRIIGNGVVPPQAIAAFSYLLNVAAQQEVSA